MRSLEHMRYGPGKRPIQGYRLRDGEYRPLPAVTVLAGRAVAVHSEVLGLDLRDEREVRMLRLHDPMAGWDLLTYQESERAREEEVAARRREAAARRVAEARNAELEARIRDLKSAPASPLAPEGPRSRKPARQEHGGVERS